MLTDIAFSNDTVEQMQYVMRDESTHLNVGIDFSGQTKIETPSLRTAAFQTKVCAMAARALRLEIADADNTMSRGMFGLKKARLDKCMRLNIGKMSVAPGFAMDRTQWGR